MKLHMVASSLFNIFGELTKKIQDTGFQFRQVAFEHVSELEHEITEHKETLQLEKKFYEDEIKKYLTFKSDPRVANPRSIFIISSPQPKLQVIFHSTGKTFTTFIPPTSRYYNTH